LGGQHAGLTDRPGQDPSRLGVELHDLIAPLTGAPSQRPGDRPYRLAELPGAIHHPPGLARQPTGQLAALAGQRPGALPGQARVGRIADVGLDHGGVDPHRAGAKAGLPLGLADHHSSQLVDCLGSEPADQLAHRGLIRHPSCQRQQAEPAQVQRVRHLSDQGLVAPAGALLDDHQPHKAAHRDRRSTMIAGGLLPGLLNRCQQPRIGQQPIQRCQLGWQFADFHRQQLVEQRLDLLTR
jgi:hypothetical protein